MVVLSSTKDADIVVGAPVVAFGWDWKEVRFARTIEGSLAVEYVSKGLALVQLVLPIGFVDGFWHLILEVPEAAEKQPSPTP